MCRDGISIHALHAERDDARSDIRHQRIAYFNPRAPCGARRCKGDLRSSSRLKFQSTRSMRSATTPGVLNGILSSFQSTRSMRSATPVPQDAQGDAADFNPRAPCGAATRAGFDGLPGGEHISIHALHAERDTRRWTAQNRPGIFQSTRSMRERDGNGEGLCWNCHISIHALHAERDLRRRKGGTDNA